MAKNLIDTTAGHDVAAQKQRDRSPVGAGCLMHRFALISMCARGKAYARLDQRSRVRRRCAAITNGAPTHAISAATVRITTGTGPPRVRTQLSPAEPRM